MHKPQITIAILILAGAALAGCGGRDAQTALPALPTAADQGMAPVESGTVEPEEVTGEAADSAQTEPADTPAIVRTFTIDPANSQASYTVEEEFFAGNTLGKQAGLADAIGVTNAVEGAITFTLDASGLTLGDNQFVVDLSTLTSDDQRRDNRIRERWLESSRFPLATFGATRVSGFPASYQEGQTIQFELVGDLTIREITRQVTFQVEATLNGGTLSGVMTGVLLMTDFGFDPPELLGILKAENEVLITVTFTAIEN